MPSGEVHRLFLRLLGLEGYHWVDKLLDYPAKWLGKRHRKLFHDLKTVYMLWLLTRDPMVALAAYLHITLDELVTKMKRRMGNG